MNIFKIKVTKNYAGTENYMNLLNVSTGALYFQLQKVSSVRNLAKALNEAADRMEGKENEILVEM